MCPDLFDRNPLGFFGRELRLRLEPVEESAEQVRIQRSLDHDGIGCFVDAYGISRASHRAEHDFSQRQLADRLRLKQSQVAPLEHGEVNPSIAPLLMSV